MPANPAPATKRTITFAASGEILKAIEARAKAGDGVVGRAAVELVELGLVQLASPAFEPQPSVPAIADIHIDALLGEVRRRFEHAGDRSAELAATLRADAAEDRLARLRAALEEPPV